MRKILIPTDFSENAMNAIKYALELFKYERSEFLIVHAFGDEVYENTSEMSRTYFEEYKKKVEEATDRALQKVVVEMLERSPNPKHDYVYRSVFGSLVDVANDLADAYNMDTIVMGTKGKTDDPSITYGSQSLQAIKNVKCPVLMVPQGYRNGSLRNILFPTDFQIPYSRRELKLLSTFAKDFGASVNIVYISTSKKLSHRQEDNKKFLSSSMNTNLSTFMTLPGDKVMDAIQVVMEKQAIDLLVMINTRHSFFENLLHTSTIERIGLQIEIPFLILQNLPRE
jgi:nucleotide-binding universal stress UspA family protein